MFKQSAQVHSDCRIHDAQQNIPKHIPLSLKQLKTYFVLKQFKQCISFIQQHFGSDWNSIACNTSLSLSQQQNIFSIFIQCYYETKDYSAIHRLFEKSRNNIPSPSLKLYVELCLKLKLFDKVNEILFDDHNQLSEQERRTLEKQLHHDRLEQEARMETAKQSKAYSSLLSSMYITKPSHDEYESMYPSHNNFEHSESPLQSHGTHGNNFQIGHQEHKAEQQKPSNKISSLTSLTRYILDFIRNYKVELALHVVSFVLLYTLLK
ncbi:hypothetical protein C9374_012785 [Naegleria lovaniensis]|uniref:Uncharacterized protein n=1 Tax=Naegleria lovaniensis TaxID=51637 RepID=A0AA88GE48_NAELO|nr:uncharacterized protein C9374_012785 [Naegleria lovaniensis]KAG2373183.1 hypothetical protein C9374_012785 [Naegleria lovaniensis]